MSQRSKHVLKKQKTIFYALIGSVFIVVLGMGSLILQDQRYAPTPQPQIDLPGDKINPQDLWMNRIDTQNTLFDQKIKYLEEVVLQTKQQAEAQEKEKRDLKQEISQLRQQLRAEREQPPIQNILVPGPDFASPIIPLCFPLVELCMEETEDTVGNIERTIPAGTTVKALLVSSVDADCGTYSSTDPIPIKLRLLDDGHLPKNVDVDLKGAIIIGSAFGNISSERIYMRLERLTQVQPDGTFVESEIAGYVSGEDGKYGVRGTVVDKSAKIITNAAISGLFSEAGQVLQSALGSYRIDNYLSANQAVSPCLPGSLNGTSHAFDLLADYYIKRAELVKPVIQVNAGRIVDVTFTHGTDRGDFHTREKIASLRENSRRHS